MARRNMYVGHTPEASNSPLAMFGKGRPCRFRRILERFFKEASSSRFSRKSADGNRAKKAHSLNQKKLYASLYEGRGSVAGLQVGLWCCKVNRPYALWNGSWSSTPFVVQPTKRVKETYRNIGFHPCPSSHHDERKHNSQRGILSSSRPHL